MIPVVFGTVKFFDSNRHFGFAETEEYGDVFLHESNLRLIRREEKTGQPEFGDHVSLEDRLEPGEELVLLVQERARGPVASHWGFGRRWRHLAALQPRDRITAKQAVTLLTLAS